MKGIACYRRSSKEQGDFWLANQKAAVRESARQYNIEIVEEIVEQAGRDEGDGVDHPGSTT